MTLARTKPVMSVSFKLCLSILFTDLAPGVTVSCIDFKSRV